MIPEILTALGISTVGIAMILVLLDRVGIPVLGGYFNRRDHERTREHEHEEHEKTRQHTSNEVEASESRLMRLLTGFKGKFGFSRGNSEEESRSSLQRQIRKLRAENESMGRKKDRMDKRQTRLEVENAEVKTKRDALQQQNTELKERNRDLGKLDRKLTNIENAVQELTPMDSVMSKLKGMQRSDLDPLIGIRFCFVCILVLLLFMGLSEL